MERRTLGPAWKYKGRPEYRPPFSVARQLRARRCYRRAVPTLKDVFAELNTLKATGLVEDYAIGGFGQNARL